MNLAQSSRNQKISLRGEQDTCAPRERRSRLKPELRTKEKQFQISNYFKSQISNSLQRSTGGPNVSVDPVKSLRAELARDGAMSAVVNAILDCCYRTGALPRQMTLRSRLAEEQEAAMRLLSPAAVHVAV